MKRKRTNPFRNVDLLAEDLGKTLEAHLMMCGPRWRTQLPESRRAIEGKLGKMSDERPKFPRKPHQETNHRNRAVEMSETLAKVQFQEQQRAPSKTGSETLDKATSISNR